MPPPSSDLLRLRPTTLMELLQATLAPGYRVLSSANDSVLLAEGEPGHLLLLIGEGGERGAARRMLLRQAPPSELWLIDLRPRGRAASLANSWSPPPELRLTSGEDIVGQLRSRWPRELAAWESDGAAEHLPDLLRLWLRAELVADQFPRLSAAPGRKTQQTSLARVFTDLRVATSQESGVGVRATPDIDPRPYVPRSATRPTFVEGPPVPFVERLLDRSSLPCIGEVSPTRVVVVGGPGQGKTTLGMYACQVLRAALLKPEDPLVAELRRKPHPAVLGRRIPVQVVLHTLAGDLARGEVTDVWGYLANTARKRMGKVYPDESTFRAWLTGSPVLLVLDGLDEVSGEDQRHQVIDHIQSFLHDLCNSDLVVVATTRPQGYRGEFGWEGWEHLQLQELEADDAVRYAEKLLASWMAHDRLRRDTVRARIEHASRDAQLRELMRTPLQVTILTLLLEAGGEAPKDQWRLFREYYQVIFHRERSHGTDSVRVLHEHPELVEQLHAEVAWRLHAGEELSPGGRLTSRELGQIVRRLLTEQGYEGDDLEKIRDQVLTAALERLVLLVTPYEGFVGFELRSLQEYHAAERLFQGEESHLVDRIGAISLAAHWRNVLRFAVGHLTAERPHLLPRLLALCERAEQHEEGLGRVGLLGTRLAFTMLDVGGLAARPVERKKLAERCAQALAGLDVRTVRSLARRVALAVGQVVTERVQAAAARGERWALMWVWTCAERGDSVARGWVDEHWRRVGKELSEVLRQRSGWSADSWALHLHSTLALLHSPFELISMNSDWYRDLDVDIADEIDNAREGLLRAPILRPGWGADHDGAFVSVDAGPMRIPEGRQGAEWDLIRRLNGFLEEPSGASLSAILSAPPGQHFPRFWGWLRIPWPLSLCLDRPAAEWPQLARRAERGELGDITSWRAAEERWMREAPTERDILEWMTDDLPLSPEIARRGAPRFVYHWLDGPTTLALLARSTSSDVWTRVLSRTLPSALSGVAAPPEIWDRIAAAMAPQAGALLLQRAVDDGGDWTARLCRWCEQAASLGIRFSPGGASQDRQFAWLQSQVTDHPILHHALGAFREGNAGRRRIHPSLLAPDVPPAIQALYADETLLTRASRVRVSTAEALASQLRERLSTSPGLASDLLTLLAGVATAGAIELLRHLHPHISDPLLPVVVGDLLQARPSAFAEPGTCESLALPEPRPLTSHLPKPSTGPVRLRSVHLRSLRAWDTLDLRLPPSGEAGQMLVFLGENGTGKSTLLRALGLCFVDSSTAQRMLQGMSGPLVRIGQAEASVRVELEDGRVAAAEINARAGQERISSTPPTDLFLVGYGTRRGTILGGPERDTDFGPGAQVETLFHEGAALVHARTWLKDLLLRSLKRGRDVSEEIFAADQQMVREVKSLLAGPEGLLPEVEEIDIDTDDIRVRGLGTGEVPLEAMSDGYLTTAGWVIDMVARWWERERAAARTPPPYFNRHMTGIVLIDEMDLHLHPTWQWRVLQDAKRVFPKMTFVVTTHNPVTLLGMPDAQFYVIRRDESGRLDVAAQQMAPGTDVRRVLTGPWFDMPTAVERSTGDLLVEHQELLQSAPQGQRIREVEARLRERLGSYLDLSLERLAAGVVGQVLHEREGRMTHADREAARQRALEIVRKKVQEGR